MIPELHPCLVKGGVEGAQIHRFLVNFRTIPPNCGRNQSKLIDPNGKNSVKVKRMKRSRIGQTGLEVTEICFGTAVLGDMPETFRYNVEEKRALDTLFAIFDCKDINFLDTSRNYGFGRSEERIGKAIQEWGGLPEGFVIATKLDRDFSTNRFDASRARQSLEESLAALGLDRVNVLHFHDPEHARDMNEITKSGGAIDEMFKMKEEGLADAVGLAMGRIEAMFPLLRHYPFDVLINHNRFNLINRTANEMYDFAHESGMAIFNAAPYAGGVIAKGSHKMPMITYQKVNSEALEPVRQIEAICAKHGCSPAAVALQFSMRDPRMTSTIVGVSKPERVHQTLDFANEKIPDELWDEITKLPTSEDDPETKRKL